VGLDNRSWRLDLLCDVDCSQGGESQVSEDTAHGQPGSELATVDQERYPVPDPGLEPHLPRLTDVDEKAANRATRQVATFFGLVPILSIGFVVVYFAVPGDSYLDFGPLRANTRNLLLGLTFGLALLFLGVGAVHWARKLMDDEEKIDYRHSAASSDADKNYMLTELDKVVDEAKLTRRKVIGRSLLGALATILLPMIVGLADLGPWPTKKKRAETIERTIWAPGVRVVNDVTFEPIKPEDIEIGQLINAEPANLQDLEGSEFQIEKAKAAAIVVRMDPNSITIPPARQNWQIGGILCYSKICTHVGCPISLWEQQTHHLLCPCHQSTFDLGDAGKVVFGPAARPLPQLPIAVDSEGYIVAQRDFLVPPGPSYFERDSRNG
jgi:ubiquinol-cytochrome c reductase iron-sulfur subunit